MKLFQNRTWKSFVELYNEYREETTNMIHCNYSNYFFSLAQFVSLKSSYLRWLHVRKKMLLRFPGFHGPMRIYSIGRFYFKIVETRFLNNELLITVKMSGNSDSISGQKCQKITWLKYKNARNLNAQFIQERKLKMTIWTKFWHFCTHGAKKSRKFKKFSHIFTRDLRYEFWKRWK